MSNSSNVFGNFLWRFFERFGAQIVSLVVSIVLARLLDPAVYGTVAVVTVFITILQVFIDSGLGNALIQKKDADDLDFSTVFYFNIVFCIFLYALLFLCSPLIARFYENPDLTAIVRVLGLTLIISGVKNVQQAYISRAMQFKKFFFATLFGTVGAAVVGIFLAFKGFGVWALICQNLFNQAIDTLVLWLTIKWHPKRMFSLTRLKMLFSYGWKLLCASLLDVVYNNLRQLIIGKKYTSADLAYYSKGNQWPSLVVSVVNTALNSVLLPFMSSEQDDKSRVKEITRLSIQVGSFLIFPMMFGMAACSRALVRLLLTDKWLGCVPFMVVFCLDIAMYPIHTANLVAIKAVGRSDVYLRLEIIKKCLGLVLLVASIPFGTVALAVSLLVLDAIGFFINAFPNRKLLDYSIREQILDFLPYLLISSVMGVTVYMMNYLNIPVFLLLILQVVVGVALYVLPSKLFKVKGYTYTLNMIKGLRHHE